MCEEIFGPVLTDLCIRRREWSEMLKTVDETSPYALTGAVFANDRRAVLEASQALRNAAGNFYINDKPTGAVVGQQPFGGAQSVGHQRQGRVEDEPAALGERAQREGNFFAAARLQVPVHGGRIKDAFLFLVAGFGERATAPAIENRRPTL